MAVMFKQFVYDENNTPLEINPGKILCSIINQEGEEDTLAIDKNVLVENNILPDENEAELICDAQTEGKELHEWSDNMTRMLLDKYDEYITEVGPMKKFRNKKKMWEYITEKINAEFTINRTAQQVENRFKTVLKRKKNATVSNTKTGSKRTAIEFEEELCRIANKDDSIQPEVMKDQTNTVFTPKDDTQRNKKKHISLTDAFKAAQEAKLKQRDKHHIEREENRDRRHREKLQLLKELFKDTK